MNISQSESSYVNMAERNNRTTYVEMKNIYDVPRVTHENPFNKESNVSWTFPHPESVHNSSEKLYKEQPIKIEINFKSDIGSNVRYDGMGKINGDFTEGKIKESSLNNRKSSCSLKKVMCVCSVALTAFAGISGAAYAGVNHFYSNNNTGLINRKDIELNNGSNLLIDTSDNTSRMRQSSNMSHANSPYRGYIKSTTIRNAEENPTLDPSDKYLTKNSVINIVPFKSVSLRHDLEKESEKIVMRQIEGIMRNINRDFIYCQEYKERQNALEILFEINLSINLYNTENDCRQVMSSGCIGGYYIEQNKNKLTAFLGDKYDTQYLENALTVYVKDLLGNKEIYEC